MVTTGFSALASTSGYDAYKSALKNTKTIQNVAVQAAASLQDNGKSLQMQVAISNSAWIRKRQAVLRK